MGQMPKSMHSNGSLHALIHQIPSDQDSFTPSPAGSIVHPSHMHTCAYCHLYSPHLVWSWPLPIEEELPLSELGEAEPLRTDAAKGGSADNSKDKGST